MKIKLLKFIDKIVGVIVSVCPRSAQECQFPTPMRILLIRPGGIGDAALLAQIIIDIKKLFPDSHITILAERRNSGVFTLFPNVDEMLCYDRVREFSRVLCGKYDVVIDTEQSHCLSAVVARLVRAPVKIGFETNERRRMFTHGIRYDHSAYESDNFLALLEPLGVNCPQDVGTELLTVPLQSVSKATILLQPLISEKFVAMFPGASVLEKRWGADRFRRVAEMLSIFGIPVVVVGGKEDRQQGEVITAGGLGLNLAGITSLSETAAVIQKSSLLLSGDSGVLHIAVGLCVPTVSLFGPGNVKKWGPRGDHHIVINKGLPCSPCTVFGTIPPCPINAQCMRDISVDEVVNAVTMLLTSVGAMPSQCCKRDWIETA